MVGSGGSAQSLSAGASSAGGASAGGSTGSPVGGGGASPYPPAGAQTLPPGTTTVPIEGPDSGLNALPGLTHVVATQREDSVGIDFDPVEGAMDYRVSRCRPRAGSPAIPMDR